MNIEVFQLGPVQTNAYLLSTADRSRGIVIDPGMNPKSLMKRVEGMEIEAILLTHAHFDHIGGVDELRKAKRCPVYLHPLEADWLTDPRNNGSLNWPDLGSPISSDSAEYDLADGQQLKLLDTEFKVLHTPGHSPGSVSFLWQDKIFSGDVLFKLSVGRTDLRGGDSRDLLDSIHGKLFELDDNVIVYPGHGPKTTIGYEKLNNPYV